MQTMMDAPPVGKPIKPWEPPKAADITKRWGECVSDLMDRRRSFALNDAFFHGQQWLSWNDSAGNVDLQEFADESEAKYRTTVNKFQPRVITYMARMLGTPLAFEVRPDGVDGESLRKARLSSQVLEAKAHRDKWELTRRDNVHYAMLGGISAISVEPSWVYGDDAPVYDLQTGDRVMLPTKPSTKLTALSAMEFGVEPGSRVVDDARWWIRMTTLTPDQAMEEYDLPEPPPADANRGSSVMSRALLTRRRDTNVNRVCAVYVYYERPCAGRSPGCVIHVVGGEVVRQDPWPFPFKRLNLVPFRQTDMAGTWHGGTICDSARPMQIGINRAYTTINNHIGKADNARIVVPMGAIAEGEDDFTGDAGEIIRYDSSVGGGPPQWMQPPQIARWLREHKDDLKNELDDSFSAHGVSRGEAPGDRNSGLALSILAEKDETPLGLMATDQQVGWQAIGEMVLQLERELLDRMDGAYKKAGMADGAPPQTDVLQTGDENSPVQQVEWTTADLSPNPVVHVPRDAVMPRSKAAVQDALLKFAANPAFARLFAEMSAAQMADVLQIPEVEAFAVISDMQTNEANWENGRMATGAGDDEVIVYDWQDHDKHVVRHNMLRASSAYRMADPAVREFIDDHINAHAALALEKIQQMQEQAMAAAQIAPQPSVEGAPPPGEPGQPQEQAA